MLQISLIKELNTAGQSIILIWAFLVKIECSLFMSLWYLTKSKLYLLRIDGALFEFRLKKTK